MNPSAAKRILESLPKSNRFSWQAEIYEFPNSAAPIIYTHKQPGRNKSNDEKPGEIVLIYSNANGNSGEILGAVASAGFLYSAFEVGDAMSPSLEPLSAQDGNQLRPRSQVLFRDHNPQK